ncbi:MAG TPA: hypothetical protein DHV48_03620 [Prolixibacteraceae bacterium]|nr:hypothetical protein [Prolixibacteraceae bacterium]
MGRTANLLFGNNRIKNGLSAYELAVLNGFVGTLTEWLASLHGDDGREIELRENAGWVEWRYVGDATWVQLFEIPGGTTDNSVEIYIDFLDTTAFVFTAPYAMKFTSQTAESGAATLSPVLDTVLAQYDDVTITPAAAGLVTLTGVKL